MLSHVQLFANLWLLCPGDSPGKSTGVGSHSLLQGIFLIQGSNPGLLCCRQILYCLSHQGSLKVGPIPAKIKSDSTKCWWRWDETESPIPCWETVSCFPTRTLEMLAFSNQENSVHTLLHGNSTPRICPRETLIHVHQDKCTNIFIAVLLLIAKMAKPHTYFKEGWKKSILLYS